MSAMFAGSNASIGEVMISHLWAAHWAKKAWIAQEKQSIASRRQLRLAYKQQKMALDQETRNLHAFDVQRRASGPFFETIKITELGKICFRMEAGLEISNDDPKNIFWCPHIVGPIHEDQAKDYNLNVVLLNKKPEVTLRNWCVRTKPERPVDMAMFLSHEPC